MPFKSTFPDIDIPKCNILTYLFDDGKPLSTKPLWMNAANPSESLSPAQVLTWVKRFAVGMDKLGIPQDRAVMVFTPNHLFVPVVYLAAAGSKRYFTGANPIYTANEVAHQMKTIDAALVLVHPSLFTTGMKAAKQAGVPKDRIFQFSDEEQQTKDGVRDWRVICASEAESKSWKWDDLKGEPSTQQICCVNFSSGTTGLPKGVCITHHNLIANSSQAIYNKFVGEKHSLENPDTTERWLAFLPLYHAYSQLWTINIACKLGVSVWVMSKFEFEPFLKYIEQYKITTLQAVPPVLVMLSKRPETKKYKLDSMRHMMCGAAPLSKEMQNDVSGKLGCVIAQGWGMTETTCAGIMSPGMINDDSGSIGYLFPNTEAKLIDEEEKEVAGDGAVGELYLRGPQIMKEYWRNEEATKDSKDAEGWFKTGDVALCKSDKFWIVDRKKELIKVNGLQVAPAELEAVLLEHPEVADAAAVGITVRDEEYPRAYVVLQQGAKATEKDVQDFVASKVAKHKRLVGGVSFIDEVPKLASGKIVRKQMKEWAKRDTKEVEGKMSARL